MPKSAWKSKTKDELVIEVWEALDCESVGGRELEQIQQVLREKFGEGGLDSPASIARTVADEGAVLRHPEVLECDLRWREMRLAERGIFSELSFASLAPALDAFARLDEKRLELRADGDQGERSENELREFVITARRDAQLRARSKVIDKDQRQLAAEISEWFRVWLQAPELFSDWLELRRRSAEFRNKFLDG